MVDPVAPEAPPLDTPTSRQRLTRSRSDRLIAGVCGGLGEYFVVDPVWFRIAFVVLALGGGSGFLLYLILWLIVPETSDGDESPRSADATHTGTAVIGFVLMAAGGVALVNTIAPWSGRYFWPIAVIVGGLALVIGGVSRDRDR